MHMQNFDDLKDLWQQSEGNKKLPSAKEILTNVETNRKKMLRKNIFLILTLLFTFVFILWIGFHYEFQMVSTRIGIIITLFAIICGITFNTRLMGSLIKASDPTLSNNAYLEQMINYRNRQRAIQTRGIAFYFILLTIGIVLYMYEFAARNLAFGVIVYTLTLGWIAFNWFYLRKKAISKQEKKINEQIHALENLAANLEKKETDF